VHREKVGPRKTASIAIACGWQRVWPEGNV
jgi:hypothetical protein